MSEMMRIISISRNWRRRKSSSFAFSFNNDKKQSGKLAFILIKVKQVKNLSQFTDTNSLQIKENFLNFHIAYIIFKSVLSALRRLIFHTSQKKKDIKSVQSSILYI